MANINGAKKISENADHSSLSEDMTFTSVVKNFKSEELQENSNIIKLNRNLKLVIVIKNNKGEESAFELTSKMFIGSDKNKCHVLIEDKDVPELMLVVGLRAGKILVKHPGPHIVTFKDYNLIPHKTYDVPYDAKFLCGHFELEIMTNAPPGFAWAIEKEKSKTNLLLSQNETKGDGGNLSYLFSKLVSIFKKKEKLKKKLQKNKVKEVKFTEDEIEIQNNEEVYGTDLRALVQKFRFQRVDFIENLPPLIRPLAKVFFNILNDLSFFERNTLENLKKKTKKLESEIFKLRINNLKIISGIDKTMAGDLINRGVKDIGDLENRGVYDLSRLLKCPVEQATEIKDDLNEKIKNGDYPRVNPEIEELTKKLEREKELQSKFTFEEYEKSFEQVVSPGLFKYLLAFLTRFAILFKIGPYYGQIAKENEYLSRISFIIFHHVESFIYSQISFFNFFINDGEKVKAVISQYTSPFLGVIFFDLLCHMLLGVSLGEYLLGIDQKGNHLKKRLRGVCRCLLSYILFPVIILSATGRGIAEKICKFEGHRTYRALAVECVTLLASLSICISLILNLDGATTLELSEVSVKKLESNEQNEQRIKIITPPAEIGTVEQVEKNSQVLHTSLPVKKIPFFKDLELGKIIEFKGPITRKILTAENSDLRQELELQQEGAIYHNDLLSVGDGAFIKIKLHNGKLVELKQKTDGTIYSYSKDTKKTIGITLDFGKIFYQTDKELTDKILKENNYQPQLFLTSEGAAVNPQFSSGQFVYRKSLSLTTLAVFKGKASFYPIDLADRNSDITLERLENGVRLVKVFEQQFSVLYNNAWKPSLPVSLLGHETKVIGPGLYDGYHHFLAGGEYNPITGLYFDSKKDYFDTLLKMRTEKNMKLKFILENAEKSIFRNIDVIGRLEDRKNL